jgi:hypothetical protein
VERHGAEAISARGLYEILYDEPEEEPQDEAEDEPEPEDDLTDSLEIADEVTHGTEDSGSSETSQGAVWPGGGCDSRDGIRL